MFGKGIALLLSPLRGPDGPRPKQAPDVKGSDIALPEKRKEGIAPGVEIPEPDRVFINGTGDDPRMDQPVDGDGSAAVVAVRIDAKRREQAAGSEILDLPLQVRG